jgi:isoleucyl-tRNA synthetase
MPWCPRCATAISQHEIVTDGYAELTHRSVTLRLPLIARITAQRGLMLRQALPAVSCLVWTTTPWTLNQQRGCCCWTLN